MPDDGGGASILCSMLLFLSTGGLAGAIILFVFGMRGRRVGDQPICDACQFDLRGQPDPLTTCPECGADVSGPKGIQRGIHKRRRGVIWAAAILALLASGPIGYVGYQKATAVNWYTWKPFNMLLADAAAYPGLGPNDDFIELQRRLQAHELDAAQRRKLITTTLAAQADQTQGASWLLNDWSGILGSLLAAGHMNDADVQAMFTNAARTDFRHHRTLRRDHAARFDLDGEFERLPADVRFTARRWSDDVYVGDLCIIPGPAFDTDQTRHPAPNFNTGHLADFKLDLTPLPNGPTRLTSTIHYELNLVEPIKAGPIRGTIPIDQPIAIADRDAVVDNFVVKPAMRTAMRDAFELVSVEYVDGRTRVSLQMNRVPDNIAFEVLLEQNGK